MESWSHLELPIRMGSFALLLTGLSLAEALWPRRKRHHPRAERWITHILLMAGSSLLLRVAFPLAAVGYAALMNEKGIGLFNLIALPVWLEVVIAMILLDLAIWAQHLVMHHVPPLWALHRVHHGDEDLDASSGIRFHPFEMLISLGFKLVVITLLGPAALAVFLFEILLNASSLFEHASLAIPKRVDTALRKLIVTPDMHRVHHSVFPEETNSNFGFCLSVWDRLFRTYVPEPRDGHEGMALGLDVRPEGDPSSLAWTLTSPFSRAQAARTQSASRDA